MATKIAVIYYSSTGNVHQLAQAVAEGAEKAGAEVRLRRAPELAPDAAIDSNPAWREHVEATKDIEVATHDDLTWADAYAFGTPTRFGNVAAQLKQFIDGTGGLWAQGAFIDKPATAFVSAANVHGGNESTLLALYNTLHHWGSLIVSPATPTRPSPRPPATRTARHTPRARVSPARTSWKPRVIRAGVSPTSRAGC